MAIFPGTVSTDTDLYVAVNDLATVLTSGINSAVTSIPVSSTTGFPASGFISIDSEIIHYSAIADSTHFTADLRGADGTTAASHLTATAVYHNVIAAHHNALKDEIKAIESQWSTVLGLSTTQIKLQAGSAAAPSLVSALVLGTGIYFEGSGTTVSTAISGTRRLLLQSTGLTINGTGQSNISAGALITNGALTIYNNPLEFTGLPGGLHTISISAATAAADRAYNLPDAGGSADFVLTLGTQTIGGAKTFSSAVAVTATSNHLVLSTATNTLTINASTQASARVWSVPDISANGTFAALEGTQTFSGSKTFSANVTISKSSPVLTITDGANTNGAYIRLDTNTSTQQMYVGVDTSAGGNLLTGSSAYAVVIGGSGAYPLQLGTSNNVRLGISSGGDIGITSGKKFLLDGVSAGGDTYLIESSANVISMFTGGTERWIFDASGNFSANNHGGVIWAGPSNSATFPDHSFYGDTNSGLRSTGADAIALTTGGTDWLTISSAGAMVLATNVASQSFAASGASVVFTLANTSNTASATAKMDITVGGSTADDPFIRYVVTGSSAWSMGIDNSDSDRFKIDNASALGGGTVLTLVSGGAIFPNGTVGVPAMAFAGAENFGFYWTSNELHVSVGNSNQYYFASNKFNPTGGGARSSGDGTEYWNDISYKTITDRGCLPWCDDGVELVDGRRVSDLEALCATRMHPTRKTPTGLPRLDYSTFPKHAYKRAEEEWPNEKVERDANGDAWVMRKDSDTGRMKKVQSQDGVEMTMIFGVMIGAFKEISKKLEVMQARITELESKK